MERQVAHSRDLPYLLEASRVYHGDCECDTEYTHVDIDPFVARVITNECDAPCGNSREGQGGPRAA
ncbi:MAG: hypothetical protein AB7Q17_18595, partial [Phycisphaerae bacterium]